MLLLACRWQRNRRQEHVPLLVQSACSPPLPIADTKPQSWFLTLGLLCPFLYWIACADCHCSLLSALCYPPAPYSKPSMTLEPSKDLRPGNMVTITCSSYQGYPEAEVFWKDGQGLPLTDNVTTSQMANEQGLFDVHSVLRVVLGANGTYSCLVRNPVLQQDAHGSVTITGKGRDGQLRKS